MPPPAHQNPRPQAALPKSRAKGHALGSLWVAMALIGCRLSAAAIDEAQIPPAATNQIDYARDIRPILDASCLKCHGPEKPKSQFRVDHREALLKGGENGIAVIPGQSGKSPLIHYVARLVEEMEMPPKGKGDPLTPHQIGLLRAWIDQDLPGGEFKPAGTSIAEVSPTLRWITVAGDEGKFREHQWMKEGWNGGLESFFLREQAGTDKMLTLEGRVLRDDYRVLFSLEKGDTAFVRAGFEQYRKYFDDSGGYDPLLAPAIFSLDRDLHLDLGKAWIEAGGMTPLGLHLTGGYEYYFKDGEKSLTQWAPPLGGSRSTFPTSKSIDEQVHVLRLDATYDWQSFHFEDNFRYEFHKLTTERGSIQTQAPDISFGQRMRESDSLQNLANAFSFETQPREWLLLSAGYLHTRTEGEAGFRQTPVDASGQSRFGLLWRGRGITLDQSAHIFNANAQLGLWEDQTLSAGVQTEWNRQRAFGDVDLDQGQPGEPALTQTNRAIMKTDYDRFTAEEQFTLRNTQIPFTVLYGEFRLRQETIDQFESQEENGSAESIFLLDTGARYHWSQYRAGFNVSPWSRAALSGYYQRRDREDTFDHERDTVTGGYPGFIKERETRSDEIGAKLVLRPASWLKTTMAYRLVSTDYQTETEQALFAGGTPGGTVLAGTYDAHVYSLNATLTPWRRLYFYSTFSFQDSRTVTEDNGNSSIVPFRGHIYSVLTTANYVLNDRTDLMLTYDFSYANYGQDNEADGLPLGIDYRRHGIRTGLGRHFWQRFRANLEYVWFYYDEPSSGHFKDYIAHGVFATVHVRWN
jgi:hypothetical protein